MRNLLSANTYRLIKSKLFWVCTAFTLLFAAFATLQGARVDAMGNLNRDLDYYYFHTLPYAALLQAVFISLFLGTEYSDGTMRNKLIVGRTRFEIYCANLLTCMIATAVFALAWAVGGLAGIPHFGLWSAGIAGYFRTMAVSLCTLAVLTVIFNTVAHLISNKPAGAAATMLLLAFALLLCGSFLFNRLNEPEYIVRNITISSDGTWVMGPEEPNPAYVGGTLRIVLQTLLMLLPPGQQIWIADETLEHPLMMIGYSLIMGVTVFAAGYSLFRKKDLK